MAPSTPVVAGLLLFLLGVCLVDSRSVYDHHHHSVVANGRWLLQAAPAVTIDCGAKCSVRCSKSWKRKMCNKLCGVCCSKCNCVPPGTSAETRAMCPCYATMTNPHGKLKCP
ncbi:cypmaclein-like [Musa acuminata AAA Group]|uniref:cypmaclein-like n=1 Tax=Musa acuminata AAA Group TaxID=214697 RepID=UPI0031E082E4